ncbi:MAG TPA: hypothetical protein PKA20_03530 [Burkholderiaceae bacterium]|nr:hypothetical protein [Burkholderiaceae bacterium]
MPGASRAEHKETVNAADFHLPRFIDSNFRVEWAAPEAPFKEDESGSGTLMSRRAEAAPR